MSFKRKHFARALLELHEGDFTVLVFTNILICSWNCKILSNEGSCPEEVAELMYFQDTYLDPRSVLVTGQLIPTLTEYFCPQSKILKAFVL